MVCTRSHDFLTWTQFAEVDLEHEKDLECVQRPKMCSTYRNGDEHRLTVSMRGLEQGRLRTLTIRGVHAKGA